jgi:exosome complex exonuclease DIS3/RRP44
VRIFSVIPRSQPTTALRGPLSAMLKSKSFVKITRKNKVVKVVREHYLRDDVWCGSDQCTDCQNQAPKLSATMDYVILDTNAILHQKDLIQNAKIKNVIVLQTVLDEVKNQSLQLYNTIRAITQDESRHFYVFPNEFHR